MKPEKLYIKCGCDNITDCVVCKGVGFLESGLHTGQVDSMQEKIEKTLVLYYQLKNSTVTADKETAHMLGEILKILPPKKKMNYVTVSPEAKQRLIDERGLSEQDFIAPKTVLRKGDICKMTVDFQFSYRKVAWKDVTVLVTHVDGDWITVQHDNDEFACPAECLEKTGTCNPDSEVE